MRFDDLEILDLTNYENEDSEEMKAELFEGNGASPKRKWQTKCIIHLTLKYLCDLVMMLCVVGDTS